MRPDEAMEKSLIIALQTALHELGFDPNGIDGWAGANTKSAAADYLAARQVRDTPPPIVFAGAGKRLDDWDLPVIGARIGVGEDHVHAVIDVEAAGSGFDEEGRVRMLFEPHVFYRELGPGLERDRAVAAGLAYPRWGQRAYPRDSYPRLLAAIAINENAALRSASWGLGQIMGFNALLAGYPDARAMVTAFIVDEELHLAAMVAFIIASGLDDELRRRDWSGFARGYNGASYAVHGYHTKLAAAYAKWARIPDTPIPEAA
ncbi:N-acetylmuramidase domain-containing protein [Loktanella salsilacus]|uniref:N-acetylmuramidase domain-containing protein n=1 Tax=Loktanella salsilacus TaxID=195913 RepID=UPI0037044E5F